jgi:hypothetical protein
MIRKFIFPIVLICTLFIFSCNLPTTVESQDLVKDISGVYCLNIMNLELTIVQNNDRLIFTTSANTLSEGTGNVSGDEIQLNAKTASGESFFAEVTLLPKLRGFQGQFEVLSQGGEKSINGILLGFEGACPVFDTANNTLPQFITNNFTNLEKIEQVSRFRSGFGHSFTDGFEVCRSMKHYFSPFEAYRDNQRVEIFAPADGTVISILDDGHGASLGLNNKQVHIRPDVQPAFTIELYHVDLLSAEIRTGKIVQAGELLGFARLNYEDLNEYASSFDIAVRVNTIGGSQLVSYFDVLTESVFDIYSSRGEFNRQDFVISRDDRDAAPLECSGETFLSSGEIENWVVLP